MPTSIHQAEIDGLGGSPLIGADFPKAWKTPRRRRLMDIAVFAKARSNSHRPTKCAHDRNSIANNRGDHASDPARHEGLPNAPSSFVRIGIFC